jgi:hypothetical protein
MWRQVLRQVRPNKARDRRTLQPAPKANEWAERTRRGGGSGHLVTASRGLQSTSALSTSSIALSPYLTGNTLVPGCKRVPELSYVQSKLQFCLADNKHCVSERTRKRLLREYGTRVDGPRRLHVAPNCRRIQVHLTVQNILSSALPRHPEMQQERFRGSLDRLVAQQLYRHCPCEEQNESGGANHHQLSP